MRGGILIRTMNEAWPRAFDAIRDLQKQLIAVGYIIYSNFYRLNGVKNSECNIICETCPARFRTASDNAYMSQLVPKVS